MMLRSTGAIPQRSCYILHLQPSQMAYSRLLKPQKGGFEPAFSRACSLLTARSFSVPMTSSAASTPSVTPLLRRSLVTSSAYRSLTCGELSKVHIGSRIKLSGWVQSIRNFGPIVFVALRDSYGTMQLKFDESLCTAEVMARVRSLRPESVIQAEGVVGERPADMQNTAMATGQLELLPEGITVLNAVQEAMPIQILPWAAGEQGGHAGEGGSSSNKLTEEVRLEHRYLDLRRDVMQRNLRLRSYVTQQIRSFLHSGLSPAFMEIETPTLFRSTPEGAREFLVPTRKEGKFYALVQSPQQWKQMLMVAGMDRYFQVARCYRDEAGRADRQPEFTQLDLEMAFVQREDIMAVAEGVFRTALQAVKDLAVGRDGEQEQHAVAAAAGGGAGAAAQGAPLALLQRVMQQFLGPPLRVFDVLTKKGKEKHSSPTSTSSSSSATDSCAAGSSATGPSYERVSYAHALSVFGSDKPERRLGMPIGELSAVLAAAVREGEEQAAQPPVLAAALSAIRKQSYPAEASASALHLSPSEKSLASLLPSYWSVRGFVAPSLGSALSRKELEGLAVEVARARGGSEEQQRQQQLHFLKVEAGGALKGSQLAKTLPPAAQQAVVKALGAAEGDLVVLCAGQDGSKVCGALGTARLFSGEAMRLKGLPFKGREEWTAAELPREESVIPGKSLAAVISHSAAATGGAGGKQGITSKSKAASPFSTAAGAGAAGAGAVSGVHTHALDVFWVTDFPLFELEEVEVEVEAGGEGTAAGVHLEKRVSSCHHPFTAPIAEDATILQELLQETQAASSASLTAAQEHRLLLLRGQHYDFICNGMEVGGGSMRIYNAGLQRAVLRDLLRVTVQQMQGFEPLIRALGHGAPPHGGIALGLDRLMTILAGPQAASSVRDVIAFPKTATGADLFTGAPSTVTPEQLKEYHIALARPPTSATATAATAAVPTGGAGQ